MKLGKLFLTVVKIAAQKNNSPKPFFLYQLKRHIHLVLIKIHMLKHHGIFFLFDLGLHNLNHLAEKGVADSLYQHRNGPCILTLQVSCAVVGNIVIFPDSV